MISPLNTFESSAEALCEFLDQTDSIEAPEFVHTALKLLTRVYAAALDLDHIEPDADEPPVFSTPAVKERAEFVRRTVSTKLGSLDNYSVVFSPYDQGGGPVVIGTVSQDLSELYEDLASVRRARVEDGLSDNDCMWEYRFDFHSHWGRHLLGALRALHEIFAEALLNARSEDHLDEDSATPSN
jgi:hypothetical protein